MEKKEQVIFRDKAKFAICDIIIYIEQKGYPETAEQFVEKFLLFGNSLAAFLKRYSLCYFPQLAKRNMRCAVFQKNYIFVYKAMKNTLIIYNVIHVKTNPAFYSA